MGIDRIFEVNLEVELSENLLELKKKRKFGKKINWKCATGRPAFLLNGVSFVTCARSFSVLKQNDVSSGQESLNARAFTRSKSNDASSPAQSSAFFRMSFACALGQLQRTTCRSSVTVLSPLVADDQSFGVGFKHPTASFFLPSSSCFSSKPDHLSLSTLSLLRPAISPMSSFSTPAGRLAGGNVNFLSPLLMV